MPRLAIFTRDLMLLSQLQGAAAAIQLEASSPNSWADLLSAAQANLTIAIVDLSHPELSLPLLPERLQALLGVTHSIVAFAPHVHTEKLEIAQRAGCQSVVSRGRIVADAAAVIQSLLPQGDVR